MDFSHSHEQQALVDSAARFAKTRLAPYYRAREKAERVEREIVQEMGALGFWGWSCQRSTAGSDWTV